MRVSTVMIIALYVQMLRKYKHLDAIIAAIATKKCAIRNKLKSYLFLRREMIVLLDASAAVVLLLSGFT